MSPRAEALADAAALRRSAEVLRRRAGRPRSIVLAALCRVLADVAAKIEGEEAAGPDA